MQQQILNAKYSHVHVYIPTTQEILVILTLCVILGVLSTAAEVAKDQAEADEDLSLKQRLALAAGSTITGASGMVDNEIIAGAMEVGGG